jgi:hypothetical protein
MKMRKMRKHQSISSKVKEKMLRLMKKTRKKKEKHGELETDKPLYHSDQ